ncbi:hypothetical protein OIU78_024879, partial [Salix suchowensis]
MLHFACAFLCSFRLCNTWRRCSIAVQTSSLWQLPCSFHGLVVHFHGRLLKPFFMRDDGVDEFHLLNQVIYRE